MAIPAGVDKVTLNFGAYFDPSGRVLQDARIYVDCAAAPILTIDGDQVIHRRVSVIVKDGTASVELVATDASQLTRQNFTYQVVLPKEITGVEGKSVDISLPGSVPVVDFDLLDAGEASDGTVVFYPPIVLPLTEVSLAEYNELDADGGVLENHLYAITALT